MMKIQAIFFISIVFSVIFTKPLSAQSIADSELLLAAANGDTRAAMLAIRRGANINCITEQGVTPLMYAAENGRTDLVKYLVNNGAVVSLTDEYEATALTAAVKFGHTEICAFLIEKGASVKVKDINGKGLLMYACIFGYWDIAELLIQNKAPSIPFKDGTTELHVAAYDGDTELISMLIAYKLNVNATDNQGFTPLHMSVQNGHLQATKLLLESGAGLNAQTKGGQTPLMLAVKGNHTEILQFLLENKADLTLKDNNGNTAGLVAQLTENKEIINTLKSFGNTAKGFPFIKSWAIGPSMRWSGNDFLLGFNVSMYEQSLSLRPSAGYLIRPYRARILHHISGNEYWQVRELKHELWTSLEYQKKIAESRRGKYSISAGAYASYTFGNYKGTLVKPEAKFHLAPQLGISYSKQYMYYAFEYQYLDYHKDFTENDSPHFMQIKLLIQIPLHKNLWDKREYNWLN